MYKKPILSGDFSAVSSIQKLKGKIADDNRSEINISIGCKPLNDCNPTIETSLKITYEKLSAKRNRK